LIWTYFRLPEPKGRTYGELDILFERKVAARKFKGTDVSPWAGAENIERVKSDEKVGAEMVEKVASEGV
jgi:SP family general alpha glucoside:H+ symporter-like MFS transporter